MDKKRGIIIKAEGRIASGKSFVLEQIFDFLNTKGESVCIASSSSSPGGINLLRKEYDYIIIDD